SPTLVLRPPNRDFPVLLHGFFLRVHRPILLGFRPPLGGLLEPPGRRLFFPGLAGIQPTARPTLLQLGPGGPSLSPSSRVSLHDRGICPDLPHSSCLIFFHRPGIGLPFRRSGFPF